MSRHDGRTPDQLRDVRIETDFQRSPAGSVLISMGNTRVICAASVEEKVPGFLLGEGQGWVTAEYSMLPSSTSSRMSREVRRGRPSGRTMEIQRLIGRSMRAGVDLARLGERTVWIDCDVIQADGGTRTASITGGFVALALALSKLRESGRLKGRPLLDLVAAVSVGRVGGQAVLDLDYPEDSGAEVDFNVVRLAQSGYVEVQGTAESMPYDRQGLNAMLDLADVGIDRLVEAQREAIGEARLAALI